MKAHSRILLPLLMITLVFMIPQSGAAQVAFAKPDFDVQSGPTAVDDFNGDGKPDFAVALDGSVIIYLSPGGGNIGPPTTFSGGSRPTVLISTDFNHDGIADLAELSQDGTITVLMGHGDGTFSAPLATATGATNLNRAIAANDFNHDHNTDLALSTADGRIFVLLGNGDGSFSVSSFASGATALNSIESADFDGDGNNDLAVLTCCIDEFQTGDVQILHGHGDGSFGPLVEVGRVSGPLALTAADMNNDGHPDLLVTYDGCHTPCHGVLVFMNRGDGTLNQTANLATQDSAPTLPAVADFNGDGIPDIAFEEQVTSTVEVYWGNGDGTFGAPRFYAKGPQAFPANALLVGDFDGDGHLDLAATNSNNTLTLLMNNGDGTFFMNMRYRTGRAPTAVVTADMNGDGIPDLVVTDLLANTVAVLLGNGDGTFNHRTEFSTGSDPIQLAVGDFNGDGARDVAVADIAENTVSILLNNGTGGLTLATKLTTGKNPVAVVVGDFNGDGIADVAVANQGDGTVSVFLGNGDGSFAAARSFNTGHSLLSALVAADFNRDGVLDLAVANTGSPQTVSIFLGNGDGTFHAGSTVSLTDNPVSLTVADFNGDGIPDLACGTVRTSSTPESAFAVVVLGNGDGTFGSTNSFPAGAGLTTIMTADINGDRIPDLVAITQNPAFPPGAFAGILLGNGDGTFQPAQFFPAGGFPHGGAIADFGGDGRLDIAVLTGDNTGDDLSPTLSILLNRSQ